MSLGITCLTTDDETQALNIARQLDTINRERRTIETSMRDQALTAVENLNTVVGASLCVYDESWHQGVVGLVASRLKDKYWRPTVAFAPASEHELRGSGRSIPGVHLRDAFDLVSKRHPTLIHQFGGHAMAAGLTLARTHYLQFAPAFDAAVRELTGQDTFTAIVETDGSLESGYANARVAGLLQQQVWGAGFAAPLFLDHFQVHNQRLLADKHLKLTLERGHQRFDAIWFGQTEPLAHSADIVYRLEQNVWNGQIAVQLIIEHAH
jgi:single-stranded-DNA-specific exonuclease